MTGGIVGLAELLADEIRDCDHLSEVHRTLEAVAGAALSRVCGVGVSAADWQSGEVVRCAFSTCSTDHPRHDPRTDCHLVVALLELAGAETRLVVDGRLRVLPSSA